MYCLRYQYTWDKPGEETTCDTVARHNGNYACTVTAIAGGQNTMKTQQLEVTVQCKCWCFQEIILLLMRNHI